MLADVDIGQHGTNTGTGALIVEKGYMCCERWKVRDDMTEVQRLAKIMLLKDLLKEYELRTKYNTDNHDYDTYTALDWAVESLELEPKTDSDCISRQSVIDMTGLSEWFDTSDSYNDFVIALSELPCVKSESKTGHWITVMPMVHECSNCGIRKDTELAWNYCPNCGCRMESET